MKTTAIVFLSLASLCFAEGPTLLSLSPGKSQTSYEEIPIPPEATEEEKAAFDEVIREARENDVAVTTQEALLWRGLMHVQDEEYEEAISFLEESIRRDPSQLPGWEGLGWSYIKTGDLERGTALWKYFSHLMPDQPLPWSLLAQSAILHQEWEEADAHFRKSLEIEPNQYDVRFWYGQNLMRLGKVNEAEAVFRDLVELDPERLDVAYNLGAILTQQFQYDEAVDIYRHINEELPGNTKLMLELASLELRVGELQAANQLCLDVLDIEPENTQAMTLRADVAEIAGQQDIRPLLDLINNTEDPITRAFLRVRLANRCNLANQRSPGQFKTGFILDLLEKGIDEDPANVGYRVLYAERLVAAAAPAESAPTGGATSGSSHAGGMYLSKAHSVATEVLEKFNPNNTRAKMVLYEIALLERRFDDALQILEDRYSNFDDSDPMAYYYRARIDVMRGNYKEALEEIAYMEAAANQGCVLSLSYTDLTESDWMPATSVRRLHEHILALQREGWVLVSPTDIPKHIGLKPGERRADPKPEASVPALARFIDWMRWNITGKRKFDVNGKTEEDGYPRPKKVFTVTFDDALRSSLVLGTPIAADFGVPFGIFSPTEPSKEYVHSRANWQEMRDAAASGHWVVGSQLHNSYLKQAADPDGLDMRNALANRLWLPERARLESMNEWDRRMRREFTASRDGLRKELGDLDSPVSMVAYPYSDIGQEDACNLNAIRSPMQSILAQSERIYDLGFVKSASGYTCSGDSLLACRRYEPSWTLEGSDVVRHAYEYHPLFIARRQRAEIAMLMNRPNLANEMLVLLRRDGYPEDLCRMVENEMRNFFRNRPARDVRPLVSAGDSNVDLDDLEDPDNALDSDAVRENSTAREDALASAAEKDDKEPEEQDADQPEGNVREGQVATDRYDLGPWASISAGHSKANDQIEISRLGLAAGLNLSRNTALSVEYGHAWLKQTIRPYWNALVITNGIPYEDQKYVFKMEKQDLKINLSHRLATGTVLFGGAGVTQKKVKRTPSNPRNLVNEHNSAKQLGHRLVPVFTQPEDDETFLLTLGATWHPRDNLHFHAFYDHDFVSSASRNITYDSVAVRANWRPKDDWDLTSRVQYWSYEDDNAMFSALLESLWEVDEDLGVWLGFQLSTVTTSEPCDFYWTPYWDQRILSMLRYRQSWAGYLFTLDLTGGLQRESGREAYYYPVEREKERDTVKDGVAIHTYEMELAYEAMDNPGTGWNLTWGVNAVLEKRLNTFFSFYLEGNIVALREYIDHSILLTLRGEF